jgi:leader peptidase (prepilin peptidase) / N-methyltransferase
VMPHLIYIPFVFAFGACVGSFLNVVVWRLPRGESLVTPPSHCPKCNTKLAWFDNIPVFGWIALGGKCRYCKQPISARYPIIEAITGGLFVLYYVAMFIWQEGPCLHVTIRGQEVLLRAMTIQQDWPLYVLYVALIAGLLASSLIDAEHFIVPIEIPWLLAALGLLVHTLIDVPTTPGSLNAGPQVGAVALGAGIGVLVSILLVRKGILVQSFAEGGPLMEFEKKELERQAAEARAQGREPEQSPAVEFSRAQIRGEMGREMLFLLPPLLLGAGWLLLCWKVPPIARWWESAMRYHWFSGLLGSLWGGLIGAFTIWLTRIVGSVVFGREAMGLGDVHLMLGVGAVIGAAGATVVFFLAPFVGVMFALYKWIMRRGREVPYVPYLSIAAAFVVLFYCRIMEYLDPSVRGIVMMLEMLQGR